VYKRQSWDPAVATNGIALSKTPCKSRTEEEHINSSTQPVTGHAL